MNPIYFGRSEAPLYGVYHAPTGAGRNRGVVLCYPFGQEYMRAHRAFRQIAWQLTNRGFQVLRFDYSGTGDSSGELEEVTPHDWLQDVHSAVQELREMAGVPRVSVLGVRLGALLAALACEQRDDVDRLVLWDPVESGRGYEEELLAAIAADRTGDTGAPFGNIVTPEGGIHYNGFLMSAKFREDIRQLDYPREGAPRVPRLFAVCSHRRQDFERLGQRWKSHPRFEHRYTDAPHDWNSVDNFGGILLPPKIVETIVTWMDSEQ
jgi:pimeloyl-ACP methyl ester carboxylesterase